MSVDWLTQCDTQIEQLHQELMALNRAKEIQDQEETQKAAACDAALAVWYAEFFDTQPCVVIDKDLDTPPEMPRERMPMGISALRAANELEVWEEYKRYINTPQAAPALQELLSRHDSLVRGLAWKMSGRQRASLASGCDFDDYYSMGREVLMQVYSCFNPRKAKLSNAKLSTYAHMWVLKHMASAHDNRHGIRGTTKTREWRMYFSGAYNDNPSRKTAFEAKHNLHTAEAIAAARVKYCLLTIETQSMEAPLKSEEESGGTLADVIAVPNQKDDLVRIAVDMAIAKLTSRQQKVYELVFSQEYTLQETAEIMTELGHWGEMTQGKVRGDTRIIHACCQSLARQFEGDYSRI